MICIIITYNYVAACRFCVSLCLISICLYLLFSNYSTYFLNILFVFVFLLCIFLCFVYSIFLYCFMLFFVLCCLLFLLLCCLFPILYMTTDHCHRVETQLQEIHKYQNILKPFYYQLMHIMLKNTELLKHSKITLQHVSVYVETIFRELQSKYSMKYGLCVIAVLVSYIAGGGG